LLLRRLLRLLNCLQLSQLVEGKQTFGGS